MIRDVKEIEQSRLWQQTGRQIATRNKADNDDPRKKIVFVVGQKSSGKSSLIKILRNDFDPDTKPNLLIEYCPSKVGLDKKQLIHFYEVGNIQLSNFFEYFCKQNIKIYFLICVDLTQPNKIISSAEKYLNKIRQICKKNAQPEDQQQKRTKHEDTQIINALPSYATIIGTKFDLIEKFDNESKKWINRTIRYISHTNSSSLMTLSNKNNQIGLQLRTSFNDLLTKNELSSKPNFKEYAKPIFSLFGDDNISDMNLPSSGSMTNIEVLQKQLQSFKRGDDKVQTKRQKGAVKNVSKLDEILIKRRNDLILMMKKGSKKQKDDLELV